MTDTHRRAQKRLVFKNVREDLDDFFKLTDALTCEDQKHQPFIVLTPNNLVVVEESASRLAHDYPTSSNVLCQWKGTYRSDFFLFTVKEFRRRYSEAQQNSQEVQEWVEISPGHRVRKDFLERIAKEAGQ